MKTTITFLFLLCSLFAFGQEIASDTVYLSRRVNPDKLQFGASDTIFYVIRDTRFTTGQRNLSESPLGDTATVVNYFTALASQESDKVAAGAKEVILRGDAARNVVLYSTLITQATGNKNVFDGLREAFRGRYEAGKWRLLTADKNLLGVIQVVANGNVVFNPDTPGEPNISLRIFQKQIRLVNAPTIGTVDLYEFDTNKFATVERTGNRPTARLVQVIATAVQNN